MAAGMGCHLVDPGNLPVCFGLQQRALGGSLAEATVDDPPAAAKPGSFQILFQSQGFIHRGSFRKGDNHHFRFRPLQPGQQLLNGRRDAASGPADLPVVVFRGFQEQ